MIKVYIELHGCGERGPRYAARLGTPEGELLVASSTQPFLDAARVLAARGVTGMAECWDKVQPFARMRGDIAGLAKLTVNEGERQSPRFVPWKPFAGARGPSKTVENGSGVVGELQTFPAAGELPRAGLGE
jgi:hypothetical protein